MPVSLFHSSRAMYGVRIRQWHNTCFATFCRIIHTMVPVQSNRIHNEMDDETRKSQASLQIIETYASLAEHETKII